MRIPDPYAHSTFHGKPLDNATIAALKVAEAELGYELTILQGIGGASASAGTHTEGRAVDLAAYDHERKVRVLRDLGFAAWYRPTLPGVWGEHIHAILIFESRTNTRGLAPVGFRQIASYDAGRNGLADNAADPNPYRPSPKRVFTMDDYRATFAPKAEATITPSLTIATWNIGDGPDSVKRGGLDKLAAGAEVICLQEAGDRQKLLTSWAERTGWHLWAGDIPGSDSVPILTKRAPRYETSRLAVPETRVGSGTGPEIIKPKVVNRVRLDGFHVFNTHLIASATRPLAYRRRKHYEQHIAVLADMVRNRQAGTLAAVGDFNAPPDFKLLEPLRALGMRQAVNKPTHGTRLIDHQWIVRGKPTSVHVIDMPSDHRAAIVTVEKG